MTRTRIVLLSLLGLALVAALAAWFFATHVRKVIDVPQPPRGEASYNPLYALKQALRNAGQRVESEQRLPTGATAHGAHDTIVVDSDPRALTQDQLAALMRFADAGGHLVLRLPPWQDNHKDHSADALAQWLPIQPGLLKPECMLLALPKRKNELEFCAAPRFRLEPRSKPLAAWRDGYDEHVYARFARGTGTVDLAASLDFLENDRLRTRANAALARQVLAPGWDRGRYLLVYAADLPPLWHWLLVHAWTVLLPLALALLAWAWMRSQRFGPLLPAALQPRRSLLEHVEANGEHLLRYGRMGLLHRALRDAVLARVAQRDPLAAALDGDAQAALLAARTGLSTTRVRAALGTRPPADTAEFHHRIARMIDLRNRL